MTLRYEVTVEDVVQFNMHYFENEGGLKRNVRMNRLRLCMIGLIVFFSMILCMLPLYIIIGLLPPVLLVFPVLVMIVVIIGVVTAPTSILRVMHKAFTKQLSAPNASPSLGPCERTVANGWITDVSTRSTTQIPLGNILYCAETRDCLLLYYSGMAAVILPLRAFASPEQKAAFLALLGGPGMAHTQGG